MVLLQSRLVDEGSVCGAMVQGHEDEFRVHLGNCLIPVGQFSDSGPFLGGDHL